MSATLEKCHSSSETEDNKSRFINHIGPLQEQF